MVILIASVEALDVVGIVFAQAAPLALVRVVVRLARRIRWRRRRVGITRALSLGARVATRVGWLVASGYRPGATHQALGVPAARLVALEARARPLIHGLLNGFLVQDSRATLGPRRRHHFGLSLLLLEESPLQFVVRSGRRRGRHRSGAGLSLALGRRAPLLRSG